MLAAHARLTELIQRDGLRRGGEGRDARPARQARPSPLGQGDRYVRLRKIRGRFLTRPRTGDPYISAQGRESWIGWVELITEHVSALATRHTAMVIRDVDAQVLGVVEAESRPLLAMFSTAMLEEVGWTPYEQVLLVDGNDGRGIDVGLMTRDHHVVTDIRTHIADTDRSGVIFSRDCAEYHVRTPGGRAAGGARQPLQVQGLRQPRRPDRRQATIPPGGPTRPDLRRPRLRGRPPHRRGRRPQRRLVQRGAGTTVRAHTAA